MINYQKKRMEVKRRWRKKDEANNDKINETVRNFQLKGNGKLLAFIFQDEFTKNKYYLQKLRETYPRSISIEEEAKMKVYIEKTMLELSTSIDNLKRVIIK